MYYPQVTITVEVQPASEEESKDKAGEETPALPPPSLTSPPDEDEVVKSKLPSSNAGEEGEKASTSTSEDVPADSVGADDQTRFQEQVRVIYVHVEVLLVQALSCKHL